MKLSRRRSLHLAVAASALAALRRSARAQAYPARPVRILVGFGSGSAFDILARLIGQWLSERMGQPFSAGRLHAPSLRLAGRDQRDALRQA